MLILKSFVLLSILGGFVLIIYFIVRLLDCLVVLITHYNFHSCTLLENVNNPTDRTFTFYTMEYSLTTDKIYNNQKIIYTFNKMHYRKKDDVIKFLKFLQYPDNKYKIIEKRLIIETILMKISNITINSKKGLKVWLVEVIE